MSETDFQRILLDVYTSQLVAHGAYLFASFSASVGFLRFLVRIIDKKSVLLRNIAIIGLTLLFSLSIYNIFRIGYYGQLLNQALNRVVPPNSTLSSYQTIIGNYTRDSLSNNRVLTLIQPDNLFWRIMFTIIFGHFSCLLLMVPFLIEGLTKYDIYNELSLYLQLIKKQIYPSMIIIILFVIVLFFIGLGHNAYITQ